MRAIIFMILSVTIWAIFPVLGALRAEGTPASAFIAAGWFQGFIFAGTAALVMAFMRKDGQRILNTSTMERGTFGLIAIAAVSNIASHLLLFSAFVWVNNAAAAAIYETWPLLVALLVPRLLSHKVGKISTIELLYGLVGFVGLVVLSYDISNSTVSANLPGQGNWLAGLGLAAAASLCQAFGTSIYAKTVDRAKALGGPVARITFLQACYCLTGAVIAISVSLMRSEFDLGLLVSLGDVTLYGLVVLLLGNVFFFLALDLSKKPTIVLLWYATPIITLLIMFVMGISVFSMSIVLGASLIIISNILANFPADRSLVYALTMLAIGLSAAITFSFDFGHYSDSLDLVAIPAGIFAIVSAFLLQRTQQNKAVRATLALEVLEMLACDEHIDKSFRNRLALNVITSIREVSSARATKLLRESFQEIPNEDAELKLLYAKLAVHGRMIATFSELLVLIGIGIGTIILTQLLAPVSLPGDLLVITITVSIVFLCGSVIDRSDRSAERTIMDFFTEYFELDARSRAARPYRLSLVLTLALLVIYVFGVIIKNG